MNILIRVDSSKEIGSGHVMRTFAIAEELLDQGHAVTFGCCELLPELQRRITKAGASIAKINGHIASDKDLSQTISFCESHKINCVILDGYDFTEVYLSEIRKVSRLLFIDDEVKLKFIDADFILNMSPFATEEIYHDISGNSKLLLGPKYALIRKEFRKFVDKLTPLEVRKNILITFGGTDILNLTVPVVEALISVFGCDQIFDVVVPNGFDHHFPENVILHKNCNYMAKLMANAELAISAGGSTLGELAVMNVPTILVIVADNQEKHARWAKDELINYVIEGRNNVNVISDISTVTIELGSDFKLRNALMNKNKSLVDGMGVCRVVENLISDNEKKFDE